MLLKIVRTRVTIRGNLQTYRMDSVPNINMVSFNCRSFKSSLNDIRALCREASIIALQEHCLLPHDVPMLYTVDDDFAGVGTSAVDTSAGVLRGRPHGGVALLWNKRVFHTVSVIKCDDVRIVAIKVKLNSKIMLIFSVYMPTDSRDKNKDNLVEFTQCLGRISSIVEENSDADGIYILGDFNAHPKARFSDKLLEFCDDQKWTCADMTFLGPESGTFTFVSDVHGCVRWLDHCVVTGAALLSIKRVWVKHDTVWSDHFPLFIECDLGKINCKKLPGSTNRQAPLVNRVVWGERTTEQIGLYHQLCHSLLKELDFPTDLSGCCDGRCSNLEHRRILECMYSNIVTILSEAASKSCERVPARRRGGYIVGWNKHVAEYHREARLKFLAWVQMGKPNSGYSYVEMCESKKAFKKQLKWCKNKQDQIKADILASHHTTKDFKNFWKDTNKTNVKPGLPVSVEELSDHKMIADLFKDHFRVTPGAEITGCKLFDGGTVGPERTVSFTAKQVQEIIHAMHRGKSPGYDSLSIEHLKYAGVHLPRVLSMFYNLCLCHNFLPDEMTRTIVVPIIKSKTGDASDKNNYRPISLATVLAKVFDSLLNDVLMQHVKLHDAQFGFRAGLSTETAILCLKQAVRYYTDRKTPVYACFLDLSKAFDTVLYERLWNKLEAARVPNEIISILKSWYGCQRNQVRWGEMLSDAYGMECGVRQGGITSPLLFNIYMNDLIDELSSTRTGCIVDGVSVNNISYADDMVLLGPSVGSIRKMISICETYAVEHGLRYNSKKSEVLVFKSGNIKPVHVPPIVINGVALQIVSSFKYLGHIVTEELKDDADVERERRALAVRGNMIARRFSRCSREVKITLFKAYCQSFYSSSLWVNHTRRTVSDLRVQYNDIFRVLMRLPRFCSASTMFAEARTDDFHAIIRKKVASLRQRTRGSSNSILQMIVSRLDCPIENKWMHIMMGKKL